MDKHKIHKEEPRPHRENNVHKHSGFGYSEGSRACRSSRHRIPIVVVWVMVSGYGRVKSGVMGFYVVGIS